MSRRQPQRDEHERSSATASVPASPVAKPPLLDTHRGRALLALVSVICLTVAYAPIGQFYLAWIGLAPWLILVARAGSGKSLFWWNWAIGTVFFAVNMWWLVFVTAPGALALVVYLGFWFVLMGWVIRGARLLNVDASGTVRQPALRAMAAIFIIATVWVSAEWLRGNLFTGLPWLYLGHTQSPILAMCQVADATGVYGISFWVVLVNALTAMFILHRPRWAHLVPAAALVLLVVVTALGYGLYRMNQDVGEPGPLVMVVQPHYPQDNTGAKGAPIHELVNFHIATTRDALAALQGKGGQQVPDLVVWSETMMPEINREFRLAMRDSPQESRRDVANFLDRVHDELVELSQRFRVNLLTGGTAMMPDKSRPTKQAWNRHNSAYLFDPSGRGAGWRYDKIHLVPFGEYIPFRDTFPPLYKFFNLFNPYESDYTLAEGRELTVFAILPRGQAPPATVPATRPAVPATRPAVPATRPAVRAAPHRFVAPICFEDLDSRLLGRMFRGDDDANPKRAQFIVNLTNDGWFRANQMAQHLQAATFRSIENRAPTARSVNTGISGFVDSVGRTHDLIPAGKVGVSTARLTLDRRVSFYTRHGDVFAGLCGVVAGAVTFFILWRWMKNRRLARR